MTNPFNKPLKKLIRINTDAYQGFAQAARAVKDRDLKKIFRTYSSERRGNVYNLKTRLTLHGYPQGNTGSIKASIHRAWMDFQADILTDVEKVILKECLRGEAKALDVYKEVLNESKLPASLQTLVEDQKESIQKTYEQMGEWLSLLKKEDQLKTV